jgi:type IV pilus assembly protein PilB
LRFAGNLRRFREEFVRRASAPPFLQLRLRTPEHPMKPNSRSFGDILIRQSVISAEQWAEAQKLAKQTGKKVSETLVQTGYASREEVTRAQAVEHGLDYIDLNEVVIPPSVAELVPESVARENAVLPM